MGLGGLREGLGRERDRSAIEPFERYAPAVTHARPTEPEESDSLLRALSGGLPPPPVLGASKENSLKQVSLPSPAPSTSPHSPSDRGSPRTRLSHMLLRASQIAVIALHGPREHLAHALAQLELLYNIRRGTMGRFARVRPPLRVPCDRVVCARRCPCAPPGTALCMWSRKCLCA